MLHTAVLVGLGPPPLLTSKVYSHFVNSHVVNSHFVNSHMVNSHFVNSHFVNSHLVNATTPVVDLGSLVLYVYMY